MSQEKLNSHIKMAIHEISRSEKDPTLMPVKFTIVDFEPSGNKTQMSKEVALRGGKTLKGKPIVARYHETTDYEEQDDNFGSHELAKKRNRYGEEVLVQNTIPIGVFTTEGYLETLEINGEMKEVMVAEGNLWYYKFQDACELLYEWHQRGVDINTSCEYLYFNYSKVDGITHHLDPIIFNAHTILASEDRGDQEEVAPSYSSSKVLSINELNKFSELVTNAHNQDKEVEELADKQIDKEDLKDAKEELHEENPATNSDTENADVKSEEQDTPVDNIEDKQEDTPVEENEKQDENPEEQEKVEDEIPTDEKEEEEPEVDPLEAEKAKSAKLQEELDELYEKFNKATETMVSLNARVKELEDIEVQFNEHVAQGKIKEQYNAFKPKFDAVGATEKFESEEVQKLVELSVHETDEGRKALLQLQSMIIDSINLSVNSKKDEEIPNLGLHAYHRKDYNKELDSDLDDFDKRFLAK